MELDTKKNLDLLIKVSLITITLIGVFIVINYFVPYLKLTGNIIVSAFLPFLLALLVAILIDPIVDFLHINLKLPRIVAVISSLTLVIITIVIFLLLIISKLIIELFNLSQKLPVIIKLFSDTYILWIKKVRTYISINPIPSEVLNTLQNSTEKIIKSAQSFLVSSSEILISILTTIPKFVTIVIVTAIATYFISIDKEKVIKFFYLLIPKKYISLVSSIVGNLSKTLTGFIRAQLILITITGLQATIGMYFLGIEYAVTIGILIGLVDLLPIVGPGVIFVPWSLWQFFVGETRLAVALLILYFILTLVRQMIEPKILAESIGLHPLVTLIAIYGGLKILGIIGIFVGPIFIIIIKSILQFDRIRS